MPRYSPSLRTDPPRNMPRIISRTTTTTTRILPTIFVVLASLLVLGLVLYIVLPWLQQFRESRRLAGERGDDVELQDSSSATHARSAHAQQSYDLAEDGFAETPVYGGRGGSVGSVVSYGGFVEADVTERGSVDTLAGIEMPVSPRDVSAFDNFVGEGGEAEIARELGEESVGCFFGEGKVESVVREDKERVDRPGGLGISGAESDIQAQLEMLEGRSSAEGVWSCEIV